MGKRIALVDDKTFQVFQFYGLGFSDIVPLSSLTDEADRNRVTVSDGDGIYLIGKEAYDYFKEFNHMGVRSENAYDVAQIPRLGLNNGARLHPPRRCQPVYRLRWIIAHGKGWSAGTASVSVYKPCPAMPYSGRTGHPA